MRFNEYLKTSGILQCARDVHEYRRLKDLATMLYRLFSKQNDGTFSIAKESFLLIQQIVSFCQKLFTLDIRPAEQIPYSTSVNGLANVFHRAVNGTQPVHFLSFASNAIIPTTGRLREKKQYELPNKIIPFLKQIGNDVPFRWRYEVILANYDFILPKERFIQVWEENLVALQIKCEPSVRFLTELFNEKDMERIMQTIYNEHDDNLRREIERFASNIFFTASFKTTPERIRFQMLLYATLGILLERHMPTCVVLDIQKQMYPYEQAYFDRFRSIPLPLFRLAKKEKKHW